MSVLSPVRFSGVLIGLFLSASFAFAEGAAGGGVNLGQCTANDRGKDSEQQSTVAALNKLNAYPGGGAAISAANDYISKAKKCAADGKAATTECTEQCSPKIKEMANNTNQKGQEQAAAGDRTSDAARVEIQKVNNEIGGYKAFQAACAPPKASCSTGCKEAYQKLQEVQGKVSAVNCETYNPSQPAMYSQCNAAKGAANSKVASLLQAEGNASDPDAVVGKQAKCDGELSKNQANAGNMLGELMKALAAALQNMKQSGDSTGSTETPATASTTDCSLEANKYTETCKCQLPWGNPRAAGCPGANTAPSTVSGLGGDSSSEPGTKNTDSSVSTPAPSTPVMGPIAGSDGGVATPAGYAGGGYGGGGAGSKGSDGNSKNAEAKKAGTASVYSGDGGGGGGGGGYGGYGDSSSKSKAGTPTSFSRKVAGASPAEAAAVTGAGGRTNWQKIAERYRDNTPTLLRDEKQFFSPDRVAPGK